MTYISINALGLLTCWVHVLPPNATDNFYLYLGILWIIFTVVAIARNYHIIKLAIKKRPVLEVNEICVFDCVNGIRYYWDDIDEVSAYENSSLHLKIIDPVKYLVQFKRGVDRFYSYSKKKKVFIINLDCVKENYKDLVNKLNDLSITALEIQEKNN